MKFASRRRDHPNRVSGVGGDARRVEQNPEQRAGLAVLLVDQRLDEFHDALLSRCGGVQLAAHLHEAAANVFPKISAVFPKIAEVFPEIDEVRAQGVETLGCSLPKVPDFGPYLGDVAIGGARELTCRMGVLR